ncbi:ATP-grasp domain-containing protein [Streptomyces sp. NPDC056704]|uniref:ATP-grasp domain-containing protein n=1 Tax=Streptomyces sp. NPDC056704 TaxID=3345917 RepID=UPI003680E687
MTGPDPSRTPVVIVDRIGYAFYRTPAGTPFLPADRFEVRLVTPLDKLAEARGDELSMAVGVPGGDHAGFREAARMLHAVGGRPAARLVSITERYLLPAAELRAELGLPGMTIEQTLLFRDKVQMKEHLRDRGIRVPDFAPYSWDAARDLLKRYGAVVLKPRLGAGSADVSVVRRTEELDRFEAERAGDLDEFEVEEFISGQLYHVDSVIDRGRVVAATAGRSIDATTTFQSGAVFRDVGVAPGPVLDELLRFNMAVAAAHPEFKGVFHHEMFATEDGVCFCEVGARAGGGGIIAGFQSRTGYNLDEVVVGAQLRDEVPSRIPVADHLTGYTLLYAGPGRVVSMPAPPREPWVLETQLLAAPGEVLPPPKDWGSAVVIVTVAGDSEAEVTNRLAVVVDQIAPHIVVERWQGTAAAASGIEGVT